MIPDGLERAVRIIDEQRDMRRFFPAKNILQRKIKSLLGQSPEVINYEELGICYFYSLRIQLKAHLHEETEENRLTYQKMMDAFQKHEAQLRASLLVYSNTSPEYKQKLGDLKSFYRRAERFLYTLETIYSKKNFTDATKAAFGDRMYTRQKHHWFEQRYFKWFEYLLLQLTCNYGRSFARWGITGLVFALSFAFIYFLLGANHFEGLAHHSHPIDYIYFSIVTFTTLGFGDIVPNTPLAKGVIIFESFMGYVMLGLFINLLQRKL